MRFLKMLNEKKVVTTEAFANKIANKGTINFSKSSFNDPHIKKVIDHVSKVTGVPDTKIIDDIKENIAKFDDLQKKAPLLYTTIVKNAIESEVFDLLKNLEDHQRIEGAPTFRPSTFLQLVRFIKAEHDQFFPLRNFIDHKYLKNERIVLIPSDKKEDAALNKVPTACATKDGVFAFNVKFMQQLIDFAYVKGVKPQGKKWKSNGGPIPDDYVYIEFLIIHEFMHFTYADFHYQKIYKVNGKIINWVGDFRTNYLLVKSGYHQLPIGLFSDDINYDRQKSYKEMIDVVKSEFDKLNDKEKGNVADALDGLGDDHNPPQPGEGDEDGGDDDLTPEDVEKKHKEISDKIGNKEDKGEEDIKPDVNSNAEKKKGGSDSSTDNGAGTAFDYKNVKPKFSWDQLLHKLISSATTETEETYQKINKRNIRNLHIARQTGAGAVKPGEVTTENKQVKICFVVDSSGSMTEAIAKVYANIENLFKKYKMVNSDFYLIKFSSSHVVYKCNFSKQAYTELISPFAEGGNSKDGSIKELFTHHFGASTNFSMSLVGDLEKLNVKDFNLILFTDSDILDSNNKKNFFTLYGKTKKNLYILADSRSTFTSLIQEMKQISKNITYIND